MKYNLPSIYLKRRFYVILLIIIFSLIILINYNYLSDTFSYFLENQIRTWGFFGILVSVFILEAIPQPFLSALVPLTTGILFDLPLYYLIMLVIVTSIIANYAAFALGRIYGDPIARFFVSERNYKRSISWFEKYGQKSITILALTPLPYFPIMGGIFKMTIKEFTLYAIIPRIIHFIVFTYLILWFI